MAALDRTLIARRWDDAYRQGRYVDEPPLPICPDDS
jgi:hypothetical protein